LDLLDEYHVDGAFIVPELVFECGDIHQLRDEVLEDHNQFQDLALTGLSIGRDLLGL